MNNVRTHHGPRTEFHIVKRDYKFHVVSLDGMTYGMNIGAGETFEAACKIANDFDNMPLVVVDD
jgi:hypothetical protein